MQLRFFFIVETLLNNAFKETYWPEFMKVDKSYPLDYLFIGPK